MADELARDLQWLPDAEEHNYPAAASYLSLVFGTERVAQLVVDLRAAAPVAFKAKDVFRASGLSLLGISNAHVEKNRRKIRTGVALSPLLLVRDEAHGKVVVADGYHRLCALYDFDEDAWIPCKLA